MTSHASFVWKKYVKPSRFKNLFIVAHSAGGACLAHIQKKYENEFYDRVSKIALTDSWTIDSDKLNQSQKQFMLENCVHFVASDQPVGTLLSKKKGSKVCEEKSAGHPKHEYTTGYAHDEIYKLFGLN